VTLAALIRKRETGKPANANPAKVANDGLVTGRPLAGLAKLALANRSDGIAANPVPISPLSAEEEKAIRAWLSHIDETDLTMIGDVLKKCRLDPAARNFIMRQAGELPKSADNDDDRRRCDQCANLTERGLCLAARRGEINATRIHEPVRDLLQRCIGYLPKATDPDQRPGRERWPGLIQIQKGNSHANT
jgi:hypothetical protein